MKDNELYIELKDTEYEYIKTTHDRVVVRAIVIDKDGYFYFVRVNRCDEFGKAIVIETSGGGKEENEKIEDSLKRELIEELGVKVKIIKKIGIVSDYYNLIYRHNINHYYLCMIEEFRENNMTDDEINKFHLSILKLTYSEALKEYNKNKEYKLGRLIQNREQRILEKSKELLDDLSIKYKY